MHERLDVALGFAKRLDEFSSMKREALRVIQYRGVSRVETIKEQDGNKGYASGFEGLIGYINGLLPRNEVIAENGIFDSTCTVPSQVMRYEAALWKPNGYVRELDPLLGDTVSFAFGMNNEGQVVGVSGLCSNVSLPPTAPRGPHAVLWEGDGRVIDLGSLPGGVMNNVAGSINNRGEVAGTSAPSDGSVHSFVWTRKSGMKDIGSLPDAVVTVTPCCGSINDSGEAVGFSVDGTTGNLRAFVWRNGEITDLNSLIPADSPLYLLMANIVNSRGEIVGLGLTSTG